jgi:hypothetical protein
MRRGLEIFLDGHADLPAMFTTPLDDLPTAFDEIADALEA